MKKIIPTVVIIIALVVTAIAVFPAADSQTNYIRIHIRANSNATIDQDVKYMVKDEVVKYITPLADSITSYDGMYATLQENLSGIKTKVDSVLLANNFNYVSTVRLSEEEFPTRTYEDLTLGAGIYDALIIELGSGTGDNWWCVAFPPLCFKNSGDASDKVVYKSRFAEWFKRITD